VLWHAPDVDLNTVNVKPQTLEINVKLDNNARATVVTILVKPKESITEENGINIYCTNEYMN